MDQVQFLPGNFLQIEIISAQAANFFADRCIVLLQPIVLLVQLGLFPLKPPEMDGAALTHHRMD